MKKNQIQTSAPRNSVTDAAPWNRRCHVPQSSDSGARGAQHKPAGAVFFVCLGRPRNVPMISPPFLLGFEKKNIIPLNLSISLLLLSGRPLLLGASNGVVYIYIYQMVLCGQRRVSRQQRRCYLPVSQLVSQSVGIQQSTRPVNTGRRRVWSLACRWPICCRC